MEDRWKKKYYNIICDGIKIVVFGFVKIQEFSCLGENSKELRDIILLLVVAVFSRCCDVVICMVC